ncbi:BTAD domain-containing putative transcriptional regulator [Kribbella sp. NPDC020789]
MRYRILGGLAVRLQSSELALDSEVHKRVLAKLLVSANTPVAVEELVATYWSTKPPDDPHEPVRVALAELRDLLDPHRAPGSDGSLIELSDGRFLLAVARQDFDVFVFEDGVAAARRLRSRDLREQAVTTLRTTLELWDEPLAGLADPWFESARSRFGALRLGALEDLYEAELACGRHAEVLPELFAATAEFPLRERLRGALMVALYRSGRQPEALQQYDELEARLVAAHNFAPSAALRMVRDRILYFDPFLILPVAPADGSERPQPAEPPRVRKDSEIGLLKVGAAVLPFVTCGVGTAVALGTLAFVRRDYRLLVPAGLSLAASIVLLANDHSAYLVPLAFAECAYLVALVDPPPRRWWPYTWWPRSRRVRAAANLRRSWRAFERSAPERLRAYGIGRPDLELGTDDGGLVDLNSAPAEVLMTIPGVRAREAAVIIQSRTWWPFWSVDELRTRGLMSVTGAMRERALILPDPDSVGGPRQNLLP